MLLGIEAEEDFESAAMKTRILEEKLSSSQVPDDGINSTEKILQDFIESHMQSKGQKTELDLEYEKIFQRARRERLEALDVNQTQLLLCRLEK